MSLKTLSAAVVSAMLFMNANAAGLGKLNVLSGLGQTLHAEIELTSVSKDDLASLAPKLAPLDAYRQANVDFNPALLSLRFAIEQRGGRAYVRVTSSQPINEPFVDMLIELGGDGGKLVREYTFLLDPPDMRSAQPAQIATAPTARAPVAPVSQPKADQAPAAPKAAAPSRSDTAHAATAPSGSNEQTASEYRVKSGDSLAKVAGEFKPQGISLDQMLVALYRANPEAFAGNNMNRLRAGQILAVPNAAKAGAVGNAEAHNIVMAQAADFNNYRSKLATQVAAVAPNQTAEPGQTATGKITAKVQEQPNATSGARDKLKLSKSGAVGANNAGLSDEEKIAKEKALADANSRVKELEKNVNDLQHLLEVKNHELADRQKQAEAAKAPPLAAAAPAAPQPEKKPAAVLPKPAASQAAAATPTPSAASSASIMHKTPEAPKPAVRPVKKITPPAPVVQEPSFTDQLMDSPFILPGVAALILGGLGFFALQRKKHKQFEDSMITDSTLKTNSLFGSTGGQSVDTNNSVFNSSFAPTVSQLDSNEVDPVAEADVYIAYGRDAQAEEILKEALRTQPARHTIRLKLLEIYANRKDTRSFEALATELYEMTKGEGDEWTQAAALGHGIDPNNPMYAVGAQAGNANAATAAESAAIPDAVDELGDLLAASQMQTKFDEETGADETSAYLDHAELTADTVPAAPKADEPAAKADANDLDFDLDGLGLDQIEVPNTIPRPMPVEEKLNLGEINFDFLDQPQGEQPAPAAADETAPMMPAFESPAAATEQPHAMPFETAAAEAQNNDLDVMLGEIGRAADAHPVSAPAVVMDDKPHAADLEFDLSDISLDLSPASAGSGLVQEAYGVHDTGSGDEDLSGNAEMATKLDLAVAYQEIGDKEGARELLDEVVAGGTSEQSERARALLAKLA